MAENFYTILTEVGLAKFANAQITQGSVNISHLAVGDGNGIYTNPDSGAVKLVNEVWRGAVGIVEIDENNPNWIVIESVIPATSGGFTIREVGLLDEVGDLIAIGKYPSSYKPILDEGSSKDLYIRMVIETANADVVQIKVDPTVVIASRKYVDDKVAGMSGTVTEAVKGITDGTITILPLETVNKTLSGAINELKNDLDDHKNKKSSITESGHVQLSSAITSPDETKAATSNAVKKVNDAVVAVDTKAEENKTGLAAHLAEDASLTKKGHVQLNSDIDSDDETKAATPNAIKKVSEKLDNRLDESMPLRFTDQGKTYRWGFRMQNGDGQFIYEEVIG